MRTFDDIELTVTSVDTLTGELSAAKDYIPGNYLIVSLQSINTEVVSAVITVVDKSVCYDVFSKDSGRRLGKFRPESVLPCYPTVIAAAKEQHLLEEKLKKEEDRRQKELDLAAAVAAGGGAESLGKSPGKDKRKSKAPVLHLKQKEPDLNVREVPVGVSTTCNGQVLQYRRPIVESESLALDASEKTEENAAGNKLFIDTSMPETTTAVAVPAVETGCNIASVWLCPGPDCGNLCFTATLEIVAAVVPTATDHQHQSKKHKKSKTKAAAALPVFVNKRIKLTFSLKESDIRLTIVVV